MTLSETIPTWAGDYIGLRFRAGGRDRSGVDCYGLVRLVYSERFGIHLPILTDRYHDLADPARLARVLEEELSGMGPGWQAVELADAIAGDVLTFRVGRNPHVGVIVARGMMLHSLDGTDSCRERFDTPTWLPRIAGVHRFGGPVQVRGRTRPFAASRIDCTVPAGLTLAEVLEAASVDCRSLAGNCGRRLNVYIGNILVPQECWHRVRPHAGRLVTVAAVPLGGEGGAKSILRIVSTIAIIAAAAYAGPALLAEGFSPFASAAIVGAGTIGLSLLISALAPPPKPRISAGDGRTSPTITGARNDARLFQPVPQVFGTHRLVPPLGARVYTENAGDDQYLRMLMVWRGPCTIEDIRIGDTLITDYEGVEVETRQGYTTDEPIRLYPNTVLEESLSISLIQAESWTVRTSATNADELSVDLLFPTGLAVIAPDGARSEFSVGVELEYAVAGSGVWQRVNGDGGTAGSPTDARGLDLLFRTPEVTFGGQTVNDTDRIAWGLGFPDAKPAYLPTTNYSWVAEGWLHVTDTAGDSYTFSIDSSDAADLEIDGQTVCSAYGAHDPVGGAAAAPDFDAHASAAITLSRGYHRFRVRVEARSTTGAIAVGWKTPSSPSSWAVIPSSAFAPGPGSDYLAGLVRRWYTTATYVSQIATTAARTDQIRRSLAWSVPRGQYDVRLRRVTEDTSDERILDEVYWAALRTIRNDDPIQLPGMAKLAIRIRATDQLNGVVDNVNCLVTSILPDWDAATGAWIERATANPASAYRAVLQGAANKRPLPDARINLAALASWHESNTAKGLEFNGVLDFAGTVFERLADIAASGRASPGMQDGIFSVVQDKPQSVPVQVITPRNSSGFRGRKVYARVPHGLRVQFLDRDTSYQRAERVVLDDGYQYPDRLGVARDAWGNERPDLPLATEFESLELFGCTSADQAFKHGRFHLAVATLRPETFELSMDFEHLAATRGDLVLVTHDVPKIGDGFGRVVRLVVDTDDVLRAIVLDNQVTMDASESYLVRVRLDDGRIMSWYIQNEPGTTDELTLVSPIAPADPRPAVGDLVVFGRENLVTREMLVKAIAPNPDLSAQLTLIDHAPAVHQADVGAIPDYDPGITREPSWRDGPEDPVIEQVRSDDWAMVRDSDGSLRPRILVYLRRPSGGNRPLPSHIQVRFRPFPPSGPLGTWIWTPLQPADPCRAAIDPVEIGERYRVELRYITAIGQTSRWVGLTETVVGNVLPPPDVQSFDVQSLADGTRRYSWELGEIPPDIDGVVIRYQPATAPESWEAMTPLHTGVLDPASPNERNTPAGGTWRFGIKMVDTAGNESITALTVVRTLSAERQPGSVLSVDAKALGWPGTKTDCVVRTGSDGLVLEAIDDATWDTLASVYGVTSWTAWGLSGRWALAPRSPIVYEHDPIDLGGVVMVTPQISIGYIGQPLIEIRYSEDGVSYTDWVEFATIVGNAITARYIHWRVTLEADPSGGFLVPTLTDMTMDALAVPVSQLLDNVTTSGLEGSYRIGVGDVRLPIDGRFGVIRSVNVSFNGAGAGYSYVVVDKSVSPGPRVQIYDASHVLADALIDARIEGF